MQARRFKSFLVAVRDVDRPPHSLLTKASRLAQRHDARLELLHVITAPYLTPEKDDDIEAARSAEITRQFAKLERTATRLRKAKVDIECAVIRDYPVADAIVRHVLKTRPDVVLAESHHHSKLARWFIAHTDWELIRSCPCPLWLVKTPRLATDTRVLAAVDPFHAHSKPAALDEEILRTATAVAGDRGRIGVGHVHPPPVTLVADGMGEAIWVESPPIAQRRVRQQASAAVHAIADRFAVAKNDRLAEPGAPAAELPEMAKRWRATLLVMGAVSRTGLKRAFIGNTAERVIDAAGCDVLVVKPRSFKTTVSRYRNAAAIPLPPM